MLAIKFSTGAMPVAVARERGAALFVALMILILMSLLAVSASQVTSLQEKMVQSYWADVRAFDATEERIRVLERDLQATALVGECPIIAVSDIPAWAYKDHLPVAAASQLRDASSGQESRAAGVQGSLSMGAGQPASACQFFEASAIDNDVRDAASARSWAIVQSVIVP